MNISTTAPHLSGSDFSALGLVKTPGINTRLPGQPLYRLRTKDVSPFLLYWGYMYDSGGTAVPLKQDVSTGQTFGLVSRDKEGSAVVLNGIRIIFYSEALHTSCKIVEATVYNGNVVLGTARTQNVDEAIKFIKRLREDWKGFIEQSVLVNMSCLDSRNDMRTWKGNVHRRLTEVTKTKSVSSKVLDIDPGAENNQTDYGKTAPTVPITPGSSFPSWASAGSNFLVASAEILEPPTRQDRPMVAQFMIENEGIRGGGSRVADNVLSALRQHLGYWLVVQQHRKEDCHTFRHCESGVEAILGLKIYRDAAGDAKNRKAWLENAFKAFKVQVENGTKPKNNGTVTCPAVNIKIIKVRCAYP